MNQRIFIAILFLLHAVGAAGATLPILSSISDLTNRAPLSPTETVLVTGFDTNRPFPALEFIRDPEGSTNTPEYGITVWPSRGGGIWRKPSNGEYNVRWAGAWGDTIHDDTVPVERLVELARTTSAELIFPRGVYSISRPITFRGNVPLKISSVSGGFATGWNPTNLVTESKLLYVGPPTNAFVNLTPAQGFRYGLDLSGITIDANGLAKEALHVEKNTRGALDPLRCINATERNFVLENSYDLTVRFSSSSNEEPFVTATPVGLAVTNAANANVFITPTISGMTDVAVWVAGQSKANTFIGGAIESNPGGAFRFRDGANQNGVIGTWLENNGATNWIDIGDAVLHTEIFRVYSENRGGRINIDGSHSSIARSSFGAMQFGASAGENRVEDVLLGIGVLPTGNIADQTLWNVKDATATLATNTVSKSIALRGDVLDLIDRNYAYPAARLRRDSIMFGDGTNGFPSVGWYRASAVSLATTNAILQIAGGANNGLWTAYVTGDAQPRVSVYPGRIALGGGGTNPPDVNLSWMAPNTILSDSGMLTVRSSGSSTLLSGYTTGSAQPSVRITIDGTMSWGLGGTNPGDVTLGKSGVGELQVTPDFRVASGLVLGGVRRTSWPSGSGAGGVVVYTNDFTTAKTFWSGMGSQLLLISNHVGATTITLSTNASPTNATPPTAGTLVSVTDLGDPGPFYGFTVQGTTNWVTTYGRLTQDWLWDGTNWVHLGVRLPLPPNDGSTYGLKYGYWSALPITSDAPSDGTTYGRMNGTWVAAGGGGGGGGTNHNSLTGLEGGGAGHYYHLSQTDHADLTDGGDSALHYHATDRNRTNHFGTQGWSTIFDADTNVWQKLIAVIRRGNGLHFTTNSGANTLTFSGNYLPGANLTAVTNADGSITLSAASGGTNSGTAVYVKGTQTSSLNLIASAELDPNLSGTNGTFSLIDGSIGTNRLSSSAFAALVARANHTGTQGWSTIFDADTNVWQKLIAVIRRGNGLHFTTNAGANTLTLSGNYLPGANLTAVTNADGSITPSASTGSTNSGTAVSVDGGATLAAANLADSSEFDFTATGTNVTGVIKTNGVNAGSYTGLVATVDAKGRLTSAATASSSQLLSLMALGVGMTNSAGTLLLNIVAGSNVTFSTNGTQLTISATGTGGGGDVYSASNNTYAGVNTFNSSNLHRSYVYLSGTNGDDAIVFHDPAGPGNSDLSGFYTSSGDLIGFTAGTNVGARVVWLRVKRNSGYDNPDTITLTALNQIVLDAPVTNPYSIGAPTLYAGNQNVGSTLTALSARFTDITPSDWYPPASNYPFWTTTNGTPVAVFSPDTTQTAEFNRILPVTLPAVPSQLTLITHWRPVIGNTNSQNIIVGAKVQAVKDANSFNTAVLVTNTVSGTTWKTFTNVITSLTGLALGGEFTVAVYADNAGSATNNYQMGLAAQLVYQ